MVRFGNGSSVLVTGAAGYIGSVLCHRLLNFGFRVTALDNGNGTSLRQFCANPLFDFVRGDVCDSQLIASRKEQIIFHLAGIVGVPRCDRDRSAAQSVNVESCRILENVCSQHQLVIYPNTNSGYGTTAGQDACTEDTPLAPVSLYGQTKMMGERILLERQNTIVLRLATVFGMSPRMRWDLLVNHFVRAALRDRFLVVFENYFKRNYVHILDVADCMVWCIANGAKLTGKVYNLGNDVANLSKGELAMKVKEKVPGFYVHFAEIGEDPDKRNYIVSSERLRQAGFAANRSLEDGIDELIKGYALES